MYRDRLARGWRAAATVAVTAVLVAIAARLPLPLDPLWLLAVLGMVLLTAVGVVIVDLWRRPLPAGAPTTSLRTRDVNAAKKSVSRGHAVDPPELQTAAVDQARRELRPLPLIVGWQPVLGSAWTLNAVDPPDTVMTVLGLVLLGIGIAGLGYSRLVQHRLNTLEDAAGDEQQAPAAGGR